MCLSAGSKTNTHLEKNLSLGGHELEHTVLVLEHLLCLRIRHLDDLECLVLLFTHPQSTRSKTDARRGVGQSPPRPCTDTDATCGGHTSASSRPVSCQVSRYLPGSHPTILFLLRFISHPWRSVASSLITSVSSPSSSSSESAPVNTPGAELPAPAAPALPVTPTSESLSSSSKSSSTSSSWVNDSAVVRGPLMIAATVIGFCRSSEVRRQHPTHPPTPKSQAPCLARANGLLRLRASA